MDLSVGGSGPRLAQRVLRLRAEGAYHVLAQAQAFEAEGRHILHLEVGEPDFLASEEILDSGVEALRAGRARYNPPAGLAALRQAIAEFAGRQQGSNFTHRRYWSVPAPSRTCFSRRWRSSNRGTTCSTPIRGFRPTPP